MVVTFGLHWPGCTHCSKRWVVYMYHGRLLAKPTDISLKSEFELAKKFYLEKIKKAVVVAKIPPFLHY